ncbi:uncharacterized protein [Musca autumnalis]|uniref:uncharacterized protein n=1 Tax=Musca autumnalis TaxID=221902 RepID=UPI003CEC86A6
MNSFLNCPLRFSGNYNKQEIKEFIEYLKCYKQVKWITDEQALQELCCLLTDSAAKWWLRRKNSISTWPEALQALEYQYSKERPNHLIYRNMFELNANEYNNIEDFIDDEYELLRELSKESPMSEKAKLEFIYGLLPNKLQTMKEKFLATSLEEFKTFLRNANICGKIKQENDRNEMNNENILTTFPNSINISKTSNADKLNKEDRSSGGKHILETNYSINSNTSISLHNRLAENRSSDAALQITSIMSAVELFPNRSQLINIQPITKKPNDAPQEANNDVPKKKKKIRCGFCRSTGHVVANCLKLAQRNLKRLQSGPPLHVKKGAKNKKADKTLVSSTSDLNKDKTTATTTTLSQNSYGETLPHHQLPHGKTEDSPLPKWRIRCEYCQLYGHIFKDCRIYAKEKQKQTFGKNA